MNRANRIRRIQGALLIAGAPFLVDQSGRSSLSIDCLEFMDRIIGQSHVPPAGDENGRLARIMIRMRVIGIIPPSGTWCC